MKKEGPQKNSWRFSQKNYGYHICTNV